MNTEANFNVIGGRDSEYMYLKRKDSHTMATIKGINLMAPVNYYEFKMIKSRL